MPIEVKDLRTSVVDFAIAMEEKLREKENGPCGHLYSGWSLSSDAWLFNRLTEEVDELNSCMGVYHDSKNRREECVDIANFCMMLFDNNKD